MNVPPFPLPPLVRGSGGGNVTSADDNNKNNKIKSAVPRVSSVNGASLGKRHVRPRSSSSTTCTAGSKFNGKRRRIFRKFVIPRGSRELEVVNTRTIQLQLKMTERKNNNLQQQDNNNHVEEDDNDVICASGTSTTVSEDLSARLSRENLNDVNDTNNKASSSASIGSQTLPEIPYRLRVLPSIKDIVNGQKIISNNSSLTSRLCKCLRCMCRLALCQLGLAWILTIWAVMGAAAFYSTEGSREAQQISELRTMKRDLAIDLSTELRTIKIQEDVEPQWANKVKQYIDKHEKLILSAVGSGYGEGGENGHLWTFPGCFLFSISILTTLGFGAPVPRTTGGRLSALIFASIGIPLHFLLILNFGLLVAVRLRKYALRKKYGRLCESNDFLPLPKWIRLVPFCSIVIYYIIGTIAFGLCQSQSFASSLLFPLDFTVAGGLATVSGHVRILYGIYLEIAVILAASVVALLQVTAAQAGFTNIGLKYGLLTNS